MTPTTPDQLLSRFREKTGAPEARWSELRAFLLLALRMERDGVLELGRLIATNLAVIGTRISTSLDLITSTTLDDLRPGPAPDMSKVLSLSTSVSRLARPMARTILRSMESVGHSSLVDLDHAGDAEAVRSAFLASAQQVLDDWPSFVAALEGAQELLGGVDAVPSLDAVYLSRLLADWDLDGAFSESTGRGRQDAIDGVLASTVLLRLLQRSAVPDLVVAQPTSYQGQCDPGETTAHNTGPFTLVVTDNLLSVSSDLGSEILQLPIHPETKFRSAPVDPDGYFYITGMPINYPVTFMMASNVYPGDVVSLTFSPDPWFGARITPEDVRDAINAAQTKVVAAVTVDADGFSYVECTCQLPVTCGPQAWTRIYDMSDPLLAKLGFPLSTHTYQVDSSASIAAILDSRLHYTKPSSELHVVCRDRAALANYPSQGDVSITRGSFSCTADGSHVVPDDTTLLNVLRIGDECVLVDGSGGQLFTTVTAVDEDGFDVEETNLSLGTYVTGTVNPKLDVIDPDVSLAFDCDGRYIRFGSFSHDAQGVRYFTSKSYHYWAFEGAGLTGPYSIIQDILRIHSYGTTTASFARINIPFGMPSFDGDAGFDYVNHYARAYEVTVDSTPIEGFRSRVLVGDQVVAPGAAPADWPLVTEVHDGYVRFSPGIRFLSSNPPVPVLQDPVLYSWEAMVAGWSVPTLDVGRMSRLISLARSAPPDSSSFRELIDVLGSLFKFVSGVTASAASFSSSSFLRPVTAASLYALRSLYSASYDRLSRGDLSALVEGSRTTTIVGQAANAVGSAAKARRITLTPGQQSGAGRE